MATDGNTGSGGFTGPVIDARVRLPSPLRTSLADGGDVHRDYDAVLDVGKAWTKDLAELQDEMDASGISHAIVHAEHERGDVADQFNEEVARLVASDPRRYSGFGTVSLEPLDVMRAVRQIDKIAELGLLGVNIQPAFFGHEIDDRKLYPLYAKASELGLAVGLHTGINYSRRHPIAGERPIHLDRVACDFPETTLIACHGAWPWVAEIVAVARRHPNVMIDFGGLAPKYLGVPGSGWEVMRQFMDTVLRDQVLFATDWPVFPQKRAVEEWFDLGLRAETLEALMNANVRRLLSAATGAAAA
jgi:predicted TIM-barrel fold metal-dependent hydrolase